MLGAGGHAKACLEILRDQISIENVVVLSDDYADKPTFAGIRVHGPISSFIRYVDSHEFILGVGKIGASTYRASLAEEVKKNGGHFRTLISERAFLAASASVAEGVTIMPGVIVGADASLNQFALLNSGSIVEHDSSIGANSHISTGAIINGGCSIGNNVFVGSGATIFHQCVLADDVVIPAGSTVRHSIPSTIGAPS